MRIWRISSGERWSLGKDKTLRYRYAAGSAQEAKAALEMASAWRYVTEEEIAPTAARLDRVLAMSWRLIHPKK